MARLLFIAPSAYPLGGVAVWLDYLARELICLGHDVHVGLVEGNAHDASRYTQAYPGLVVERVPNSSGSAEGRVRALVTVLERVRPDVVLGVNIADLFGAVRRLRIGGNRVRLVMTLHAIEGDMLSDVRKNLDVIDSVVSTNKLAVRLCAERAGLDPMRSLYAPYGVDLSALQGLARSASEGPLRIVWVGRLEQSQKRVHLLLPLLEFLEQTNLDYTLAICGDGPERILLEQNLAPLIDSGRVEFLGSVPVSRVSVEVYANADVLLLTSAWETGPLVVWEAMAAGLCVVTTRYVGSGLEGALVDGKNCLMFDIDDAAGGAACLARCVDAGLRKALVANGQSLVSSRYSRERSVSAWSDVLGQVMSLPELPPVVDRPVVPSGRLDRLLGVSLAESVRTWLGITYRHIDAGGEWPHSCSSAAEGVALVANTSDIDQASTSKSVST